MLQITKDGKCRRHLSHNYMIEAMVFLETTHTKVLHLCENLDTTLATIARTTPIDDILLPQNLNFNSKCTILVCGLLKAGKSMLLTELFREFIILPSDEMPCTSRFVRLVYNDTPVLRELNENGDVKSSHKWEGKRVPFHLICLDEEDRRVESNIRVIIEIGIPHPLLKNGLQIVDCPGIGENSTMSKVTLQLLNELSPDIIIYVFDNRLTFSVKDTETLDHIKTGLEPKKVPVIYLGNRIDIDDEANSRDVSEEEEISDEDDYERDDPYIGETEIHRFNKKATLKEIERWFQDTTSEDVLGISAAKMREHRTTDVENKMLPFLEFVEMVEKRIGERIRKLALKDIDICRENLVRLARVFCDSVEDKSLSLCYDETQTIQDLSKLTEMQLVTRLQELHSILINTIAKELTEKWNLLSYSTDIAKLVEDIQTRLDSIKLDSGTGSTSLIPIDDTTGTGICNHAQLNDITMFLVDRCVNVVSHCLRMSRYNEIIRLRMEHFSRLLLLYRVPYWHSHCTLNNDMFTNVQMRIREICMHYFKTLESVYLAKHTEFSSRRINHEHYTQFLVKESDIVEEFMSYFQEMVGVEEESLLSAVKKRCDELERAITSVGIQNFTLQDECSGVCFILLQINSLSRSPEEIEILGKINSASTTLDLSEGFYKWSSQENGYELTAIIYKPMVSELQLACIRETAKNLVVFDAFCFRNDFFHSILFYNFDEVNCCLQIVCKCLTRRLLTVLPKLSFSVVFKYITTVLEHLEKIHKSRRVLRNFRPDNFVLNSDDSLKLNLYLPCSPFLPIIFGDETLGPPFYIHPTAVKSSSVTPAQEMYTFAWFVWILLEGSGTKVPSTFSGIGNTVTEMEKALSKHPKKEIIASALNDLGEAVTERFASLLKYCWKLPTNTNVTVIYDKIHKIMDDDVQ